MPEPNEEKRRALRLTVESLTGRMISTSEVEIINMSLGGLAFKVDKYLHLGEEHTLKLELQDGVSEPEIRIRLTVEGRGISERPLLVDGDEELLERAFENLVRNAPARAAIRPAAQAQHTKPKNAALLAAVGAVVVALGVGAVYFVVRGPAPQAAPATTLPPPSLLPRPAPVVADATPQEPTPEPEAASPPQAEAASPPKEVAEPAPMPTATPTPASISATPATPSTPMIASGPATPAGAPTSAPAAATNAAAPSKPARLGIDFEHSLKSGTLRVWVDEERVIEEQLDGRAKKIAGIRFRKGGFSDSLELAPGRHEVRVQVAWEDNLRTETIWGNFKAGATRRLKGKLGGFAGTGLKKKLDLEWQ